MSYELHDFGGAVPVKTWTKGVPIETEALNQLANLSRMPIIKNWVAVMPDVHWGIGATIGSVIPTVKAIIPAAVGVDIGCGMMAMRTSLNASQLPDDLGAIRRGIEKAVPHGGGGRGQRDTGSWGQATVPAEKAWKKLGPRFDAIAAKYKWLKNGPEVNQLGTLGGGNHFIEICLDEANQVWIMLHSGSRGVGNRIGRHFIEMAKKDMGIHISNLPHQDLAYFDEGTEHFDDYVAAVDWAQAYARTNRELMMEAIVTALKKTKELPQFKTNLMAVNCHHNYVQRESHYGEEVLVTRKGAVRAGEGDMGIIPGSMGAKSFIVRGKGNPESFHSCSHGAGRAMSRTKAKKIFSIEDHIEATRGVECKKDVSVLDETPGAYKNIDDVMAAQSDLVDIVHTLKQIVCVKG